jgi:hypothetical protein
MSTIDVLRPVSVRTTGSGTAVPSGTLSSVTSDNSDTTYIDFDLVNWGNFWNLRVGSHTPAAGYQRHRIRGRIRIRSDVGTLSEDIDVGRGTSPYISYSTVPVTSAFQEQASDWFQDSGYGLALAGALADLNIGGGWLKSATGGATKGRTAECYVDIDCRLQPTYSPEVRDNAGVNRAGGTVTDTNQPDLYFGSVGYDDLPPLDWTILVKSGSTTVYSQTGSGTPPSTVPVTTGLINGSYTAVFTARSTIRGADPFELSQTLSFSVDNDVPPPSPPLISVTEQDGGYLVSWADPGGQSWDNDYVVAEVWRDDCTGSQRIATVPDGLNGSYLDLAIPQLDPQVTAGDPDCEPSAEPCDITYRVRYWGYVSTSIVLPSNIPDDLILGWPSTAASLPAGWTRVTSLDGIYPMGSAGTGVPSATGGAATHLHTTPNNHRHTIGAHSHGLGGNVQSSNQNATSARYSGAGQAQANQPHVHARPSSVGSAGPFNSGPAQPGTQTASNLPATREVIWMRSDGARTEYPIGALGWATEVVSGWVADSDSAGRFLKGAAAAGNGGASSGSATHTHVVNQHIHTGISHDHSIGSTGLSTPVGVDAGSGGSTGATPRYLTRHTHPMEVVDASTNSLGTASAGNTSAVGVEPPHRRLSVLRNTGGGIQTRIIGLYTGDVASLDPILTLCNGGSGTPDMRSLFCRDTGSDSVNSTGGSTTHSHTTPQHDHPIAGHSHDTNTLQSTNTSYLAPTFGDLGDSPTVPHLHATANTDNVTASTATNSALDTDTVSHLPPYKEAHFVRLDGTISGGPLPVPELRVTDFASATVPAFTYDDDLDRLASLTDIIAVVTDRSHDYPRLVTDSTPLDGGLHTVSVTLAGEDLTLTIGVVGRDEINALEALLSSDWVYWSPIGGTPGWFAPAGWRVTAPAPDVKVVQITMTRQPWPATDAPEVFL